MPQDIKLSQLWKFQYYQNIHCGCQYNLASYIAAIKNWHDISLLQPSHGECLLDLLWPPVPWMGVETTT